MNPLIDHMKLTLAHKLSLQEKIPSTILSPPQFSTRSGKGFIELFQPNNFPLRREKIILLTFFREKKGANSFSSPFFLERRIYRFPPRFKPSHFPPFFFPFPALDSAVGGKSGLLHFVPVSFVPASSTYAWVYTQFS